MVERPIKKSERLANPDTSQPAISEPDTSDMTPDPKPFGDSGRSRPILGKDRDRDQDRDKDRDRGGDRDKGRGKGKGGRRDSREDDSKPAVSPALLRGPKPTKPKLPVAEVVPEVAEEVVPEVAEEVVSEVAEVTPVEDATAATEG